jgi:hypothetical protein
MPPHMSLEDVSAVSNAMGEALQNNKLSSTKKRWPFFEVRTLGNSPFPSTCINKELRAYAHNKKR